jgi:bacteriophage HK97-gp10 putative tail-component
VSNVFITTVEGVERIMFEWQITQRRAAASIIPIILSELKRAAPVSTVKADGGRFKGSIGYRVESGAGMFRLKFVSTAPYAKYVIKPTAGGMVLTPQQTMAMRFQDGFGDYVFASSVVRGATPGNDFNVQVAKKMQPLIKAAFKDSITIIST